MLNIRSRSLLLLVIFSLNIGQACQESSSQEDSKTLSAPKAKNNANTTQKSTNLATNNYAYSPNNPYKSTGADPLAALYGGKVGQAQSVSVKDLKSRFDSLSESPLVSPFPRAWKKSISNLRKQINAKVTKWSSTTRTRMERSKRDKVILLTINCFGTKSKLEKAISQTLSRIKELKGLKVNFDQSDSQVITRGAETAELSVSTESAQSDSNQESYLLTLDIAWRLERANPEGDLKNCRYVHALEPSLAEADVPWAMQHFKSTSTRRFVEWFVSQKGQDRSWTATWLYRNGSYRDKGVGWWTRKLEARGAKQKSSNSMEQVWTLPSKFEIDWWPESDPSAMGCEIAGPLLSVRFSKASSD